jgi:hypothetical protein
MLTTKDLNSIRGLIQQELEPIKSDFSELKQDFRILQTSVDNIARTVYVHDQKIKIINHRLHQLENPA